jgi:hypothetical protein
MQYVCIRCGDTWSVGETTDEPSGGLCDRCITQYVRDKQKYQGNHDCFRRATENCARTECSYWEPCLRVLNNFADEEKDEQ